MIKRIVSLFLLACVAIVVPASYVAAEGELSAFPSQISPDCRNGRAKIYDECSDQVALFNAALAAANGQGKVLLVSFGAEWCIWCHVFEAYIHGEVDEFTHRFSSSSEDEWMEATIYERAEEDVSKQAADLAGFVADSFVIVNIDSQHAPGGVAALEQTGALEHYDGGLPFIFTVDAEGRFAAKLDPNRVQVRRDTADWFRGYDRGKLRLELHEMHGLARKE